MLRRKKSIIFTQWLNFLNKPILIGWPMGLCKKRSQFKFAILKLAFWAWLNWPIRVIGRRSTFLAQTLPAMTSYLQKNILGLLLSEQEKIWLFLQHGINWIQQHVIGFQLDISGIATVDFFLTCNWHSIRIQWHVVGGCWRVIAVVLEQGSDFSLFWGGQGHFFWRSEVIADKVHEKKLDLWPLTLWVK